VVGDRAMDQGDQRRHDENQGNSNRPGIEHLHEATPIETVPVSEVARLGQTSGAAMRKI
jgi:hypothetical protein